MKKTHYNMVSNSFAWFCGAVCAIISLAIFPTCCSSQMSEAAVCGVDQPYAKVVIRS